LHIHSCFFWRCAWWLRMQKIRHVHKNWISKVLQMNCCYITQVATCDVLLCLNNQNRKWHKILCLRRCADLCDRGGKKVNITQFGGRCCCPQGFLQQRKKKLRSREKKGIPCQ
jgi:hypothetical protein